MNHFLCVVPLNNAPLSEAQCVRYGRIIGRLGRANWHQLGSAAVLTVPTLDREALAMVQMDGLVGLGNVRLDNRSHVARLACQTDRGTDLAVASAAIRRQGTACISEFLGDFGFLVMDQRNHEIIAARDPFGVHHLYYSLEHDLIAFSSSVELLGPRDEYDLDFIADFLATGAGPAEHTIFTDVREVEPGCCLMRRNDTWSHRKFWSYTEHQPTTEVPREAVGTFRELFATAVTTRLTGRDDTWAHLSGGLDSSSIVSTAQSLALHGDVPRGLAGTVSFVDTLSGEGDERPYSNAVIEQYGVRNEAIQDYWAWQDDGLLPPVIEGPHVMYPFYARDRQLCAIVRSAGGRVLLSGLGSDHYLVGNMFFFADWLAQGQILRLIPELVRWSMAGRRSFWRLALEQAVAPNLPVCIRRHITKAEDELPSWVHPAFMRHFAIQDRLASARCSDGMLGNKYSAGIGWVLGSLRGFLERIPPAEGLEVRYPFLYRPMVEFALRLPWQLRTRPHARKWVLREAMRGVLPERVRTRVDKGGPTARFLWSLSRERKRVDDLTADPLLGQLGCVRVDRLREAVDQARTCGRVPNPASLMTVLSLETWLRVRSGRWNASVHAVA